MKDISELLEIKKKDVDNQSPKKKNTSVGYWSFDYLISVEAIKIVYAIGVFVLTIIGLFLFLKDEIFIWNILLNMGLYELMEANTSMFGLGIITLGNLFWRMICERWLILFRISESLTNIEKQKQK